jgi:phospholipid/cholesterol/gamma-HCH transport system permease protein
MNTTFTGFMQDIFMFLGGVFALTLDIARDLFTKRWNWKLIGEQMFQIGERSLPLISICAVCTGMVMTLQFGMGLGRFGGTLYVPRIVTVSIMRELGPVFTALMIAARVGAGIASEVGSMAVTQQIDAIRAMGTSPIQKIVLPRVIASFLTIPLLVAIANVIGFFGGLIIGIVELRLDGQFYILKSLSNLILSDYMSGFGKTFFFALFISIPSCYFGMNVKEGTKGVGIATTKAVVASSMMVLLGDFFLTKLFIVVQKMF